MRAGRIPVTKALDVLHTNIVIIGTVTGWAKQMGYSRSYFSSRFHALFGRRAVDVLIEAKFERAEQLIKQNPDIQSCELAAQTGFPNSRALRRFLRNNYALSLAHFRKEVLDVAAHETG